MPSAIARPSGSFAEPQKTANSISGLRGVRAALSRAWDVTALTRAFTTANTLDSTIFTAKV
ncbi:MAG TPA: hypothetical protein VFU90_13400, partial [Candidatus Tumulicola sp.]|nr:hypothetical protein [Candidatus Tumulicola sp.]